MQTMLDAHHGNVLNASPRFALSYYVGMFLILLFLVISIMRHMQDIRPEEAVLLTILAASILFVVFGAWKAVTNGK